MRDVAQGLFLLISRSGRIHSAKEDGTKRIIIWCEIWKDQIIGLFFFQSSSVTHLNMLREEALPSVLNEEGYFPERFQQETVLLFYYNLPLGPGLMSNFLSIGRDVWDRWNG